LTTVANPSPLVGLAPLRLLLPHTVGVGHANDPDPLALMGGAHVVRTEHTPFRIVPHRGQVTEDDVKSAKSEGWAVFHEDEGRSHFANDAGELAPKSRPFTG
jgi:hypothetical protein